MERADDDAISRWIFGGDVAVDVYSCLDGLASHLACIKCRSQVLLTGGPIRTLSVGLAGPNQGAPSPIRIFYSLGKL